MQYYVNLNLKQSIKNIGQAAFKIPRPLPCFQQFLRFSKTEFPSNTGTDAANFKNDKGTGFTPKVQNKLQGLFKGFSWLQKFDVSAPS